MSHEKRGYRALMPVVCRIIRRWFAKAVHGPAERRGVISGIFKFQVGAFDQALCQSMLAKQGGPVQCRLSAFPAQVRLCACIQQSDRDVFGTEAGRADERCLVFAFPAEIHISASCKKCVDEWQFLALWQHAVEQHVRNIVQRVRENATVFTPRDKCVGLCWVGRENPSKFLGVAIADCRLYVHVLCGPIEERGRLHRACSLVAESLREQAICSPRPALHRVPGLPPNSIRHIDRVSDQPSQSNQLRLFR